MPRTISQEPPFYGSSLVKCLQSGGMYHASDMAVHPHTFPYRQVLPQAIRHHHERLEGGWQADFISLRRAEVIQPGTIQTGELSEATVVPENKLAAIKFAPEVTSYKVTSPELTSAAEPSPLTTSKSRSRTKESKILKASKKQWRPTIESFG